MYNRGLCIVVFVVNLRDAASAAAWPPSWNWTTDSGNRN